MKIKYKGAIEQYCPKALKGLRSIGNNIVNRNNRRPPIEIYSSSFSRYLQKTKALIEEIRIFSSADTKNEMLSNRLLSMTEGWLYSIVEHMDSCVDALYGVYFDDIDNQCATKQVRKFKADIKGYRSEWAKIVNFIKHNQGVTRIVYFHWRDGFVAGFFIEGVVETGVIGPEPTIHDDSNSAFSYNRMLAKSLCDILFVSNIMDGYLYNLHKGIYDRKGFGGSDLHEVYRKISVIPMQYFPDERAKPIPYFHAKYSDKDVDILVEMPKKGVRIQFPPPGCKLATVFSVGEVSRTYKLPYFGELNA